MNLDVRFPRLDTILQALPFISKLEYHATNIGSHDCNSIVQLLALNFLTLILYTGITWA